MAAETGRLRVTRELLFAAFVGPSTETDDPRLLERIASAVQTQTVRAGEVVFREGEETTDVHFMTEGRMRLSRVGHADWVYVGRWVIGTTDVLAGRPRSRTATMETDARLFRLSSERWFEVMQDRPEVLLEAVMGFGRGAAALHLRLAPDGGFPPPPTSPPRPEVASLAGRARLLASLPFFAGVTIQVLVELAGLTEHHELAPGAIVFGDGVGIGRIFVVTRGLVAVRHTEPALGAVFAAGSVAGGAVCLGGVDDRWSARAQGPAQAISFAIDDLLDHVSEHREAVHAMMASVSLERERLCEVLAERLGELVLG